MNWSNILNYVYIGAGALSIIVSIIISIIKGTKSGSIIKTTQEAINSITEQKEDLEKEFSIVKDLIPQIVEEAEESGMTGIAKKVYAMSKLVITCSSMGLDFSKLSDMFSEQIEKIVALTKSVNKGTQDSEDNQTVAQEIIAETSEVVEATIEEKGEEHGEQVSSAEEENNSSYEAGTF